MLPVDQENARGNEDYEDYEDYEESGESVEHEDQEEDQASVAQVAENNVAHSPLSHVSYDPALLLHWGEVDEESASSEEDEDEEEDYKSQQSADDEEDYSSEQSAEEEDYSSEQSAEEDVEQYDSEEDIVPPNYRQDQPDEESDQEAEEEVVEEEQEDDVSSVSTIQLGLKGTPALPAILRDGETRLHVPRPPNSPPPGMTYAHDAQRRKRGERSFDEANSVASESSEEAKRARSEDGAAIKTRKYLT